MGKQLTLKSGEFQYHMNVVTRQRVNDVFMVVPSQRANEKPIVIKAETVSSPMLTRGFRSHQGRVLWTAGYGFRITKLK